MIAEEDTRKTGVSEFFRKLSSSETGLSVAEAEKRIQEYGYNEIPEKKINPLLRTWRAGGIRTHRARRSDRTNTIRYRRMGEWFCSKDNSKTSVNIGENVLRFRDGPQASQSPLHDNSEENFQLRCHA